MSSSTYKLKIVSYHLIYNLSKYNLKAKTIIIRMLSQKCGQTIFINIIKRKILQFHRVNKTILK